MYSYSRKTKVVRQNIRDNNVRNVRKKIFHIFLATRLPQPDILANILSYFLKYLISHGYLVRNERSDQKESFKHVFAGRVSSVSSQIAKQLPGSDQKNRIAYQKCVHIYR